ncbi:MAG: hypothetical protein A2287_06950 [Candidatus Melainabacteria bacterium RIFOXYA12_FULL_32_12]|nr:MAG: hypothetical protein A2104_00550 [Candidatus Melainabacteria bacterium GWF2_32_7]OGI17247.1 MAG: hypothetical protein A2255_07570 [Candidatus Melainabacteria bacterium RIFOXYA2_FULL_32_9]OGI24211.1 MAG: hypothetical protein A2287_06950 [Candidatus Melainabacteria bacterium RIFOXYA12_FULL_32_12]
MIKPVSFTQNHVPQLKVQQSAKMPQGLDSDQVAFGSMQNVVKTVIDKGNKLDDKMIKKFFLGSRELATISIGTIGAIAAPLVFGLTNPLGYFIAPACLWLSHMGAILKR